MQIIDTYKLYLVGYPLFASICLYFVGFRATKEMCTAQVYDEGWMSSFLLAAGLPLHLSLNLASDAFQLSANGMSEVMIRLGWRERNQGAYRDVFQYSTPYCLKQSLYDVAGASFTRRDVQELKRNLQLFLGGFPPGRVPQWSTVEEGFALAEKLSSEPNPINKSNERLKEKLTKVDRKLATLLSQSDRLLSNVYHKEDFLNSLTKDVQKQKNLEQDVIYEIPNYPFERLLGIVASKVAQATNHISATYHKNRDSLVGKDILALQLDFIKSSPLHLSRVTKSFIDKQTTIQAFQKQLDHYVDEEITKKLLQAKNIKDMLETATQIIFGSTNTVLQALSWASNFADYELGATVAFHSGSHKSNPCGYISAVGCINSFSRPAKEFDIPMFYSPENAIFSGVDVEDPWIMDSNKGTLQILLPEKINPTVFALFTPETYQDPHSYSKPKDIKVWGLVGRKLDLLATHTCNYLSTVHLIELDEPTDALYESINLEILNNHGNDNFTAIYQFGVYGYPGKKLKVE